MNFVLVAVLAVVLVGLVLSMRSRDRKIAENPDVGLGNNRIGDGIKRLNANKQKYAVMTGPLLGDTPDEQLIEAVLSNLWAKMRPDMADANAVMQGQSTGRQYVYALYAVTGSVDQVGFDKTREGPEAPQLPVAVEALQALELPQSADLLREAIASEDADAYNEPYLETFHGEGGKARMVDYIRAHAGAFCDLV